MELLKKILENTAAISAADLEEYKPRGSPDVRHEKDAGTLPDELRKLYCLARKMQRHYQALEEQRRLWSSREKFNFGVIMDQIGLCRLELHLVAEIFNTSLRWQSETIRRNKYWRIRENWQITVSDCIQVGNELITSDLWMPPAQALFVD